MRDDRHVADLLFVIHEVAQLLYAELLGGTPANRVSARRACGVSRAAHLHHGAARLSIRSGRATLSPQRRAGGHVRRGEGESVASSLPRVPSWPAQALAACAKALQEHSVAHRNRAQHRAAARAGVQQRQPSLSAADRHELSSCSCCSAPRISQLLERRTVFPAACTFEDSSGLGAGRPSAPDMLGAAQRCCASCTRHAPARSAPRTSTIFDARQAIWYAGGRRARALAAETCIVPTEFQTRAPAVLRLLHGAGMSGGTRAAGGAVSDPLRECRAVFKIDIHPARTLNVQEAVRDELNSKLMRCVQLPLLRAGPQRASGCGRKPLRMRLPALTTCACARARAGMTSSWGASCWRIGKTGLSAPRCGSSLRAQRAAQRAQPPRLTLPAVAHPPGAHAGHHPVRERHGQRTRAAVQAARRNEHGCASCAAPHAPQTLRSPRQPCLRAAAPAAASRALHLLCTAPASAARRLRAPLRAARVLTAQPPLVAAQLGG